MFWRQEYKLPEQKTLRCHSRLENYQLSTQKELPKDIGFTPNISLEGSEVKSKEKLENAKRGRLVHHTEEMLEEGISAREGCAMPKTLGEPRLGSKTKVSALQ